jgi:polysaccharide export outer membrane protein
MKAKAIVSSESAWFVSVAKLFFFCLFVILVSGCKTDSNMGGFAPLIRSERSQPIVLSEGDSLRITFPSNPNFNTTQPIRRDGKLALPLVGEVVAAGKTPAQLEKELNQLYSKQIVSTDPIIVEIVSSAFPVYVTGAVGRPGKVLSDRPITALEAILESGGFAPNSANLKSVRILRNQEGTMQSFTLNLKTVMKGATDQVFYLKPYDIVYVPEKFSWF